MHRLRVEALILESLEHERSGVAIYLLAIACAQNGPLRREWERCLAETQTHVSVLETVCTELGLDARRETPGRAIVRHQGAGLVQAMHLAVASGDADAAELLACECVVAAETKDQLHWELLAECAEHLSGRDGRALKAACATVGGQEEEHLLKSKGYCRELWLRSLGVDAGFKEPTPAPGATSVPLSRGPRAGGRNSPA